MPETNQILQSAIELAHLGLAELDADGRFVDANPAFLATLGTSASELLGRHWHVTVHPDDHGRAQEALPAGALPRPRIR